VKKILGSLANKKRKGGYATQKGNRKRGDWRRQRKKGKTRPGKEDGTKGGGVGGKHLSIYGPVIILRMRRKVRVGEEIGETERLINAAGPKTRSRAGRRGKGKKGAVLGGVEPKLDQ